MPMDSSGDCHAFTTNLAQKCTEKYGVDFRFGTSVVGATVATVKNSGNQKRVQSLELLDGKTVNADEFVFCAGSETPRLLWKMLKVYVPIYPLKGYSLTFSFKSSPKPDAIQQYTPVKPSKPNDVTTALAARARDTETDIKIYNKHNGNSKEPYPDRLRGGLVDLKSEVYCTRLGTRLRVASIGEFDGYNCEPDPKIVAALEAQTKFLFPSLLKDEEKPIVFAGLRPLSADDMPIVGSVQEFSNVYINGGHGGMGFALGPGCSFLLAHQLRGPNPLTPLNKDSKEEPDTIKNKKEFSLSRFPWPLRSIWH